MKAVRFDQYGDVDVLTVADVPVPKPGAGQVLVRVRAAGINPGEAKIRENQTRWPATFPSGQGSDLAGVVDSVGPDVTTVAAGDEVIGWVDTRSSQAEYAVVDAANVVPRPEGVPWEAAGALAVAGFTAWAAVRSVNLTAGDTLVISGAAGGVGSLTVQLAKRAGATVVGIAGEDNLQWLRQHGAIPVKYGEDLVGRIFDALQTTPQVDAFIDTYGGDYVEFALNELDVEPSRIDTIVRFDAVQGYGVKSEGNMVGASAANLAELAGLINKGELEVPIAATYPLDQVREAYTRLATGHVRGKIVLIP